MYKTSKQDIKGYRIPGYIIEILTNNYCPSFLRMSVIKEKDSYKFSYNTDEFSQMDYQGMNTVGKLRLVKSILHICKLADDYLISPNAFLIEPELIYSRENSTSEDKIHILFYPDQSMRSYSMKIGVFVGKIKEKYNKQESEVLDALIKMTENEEWIKIERYIDKNIDRLAN